MRKRQFTPMVEGAALEPRLALAGVGTDPAIPFVVAPPGVSQAALNFTTLRASQVLHGTGHGRRFRPGLERLFDAYIATGDVAPVQAALPGLAVQVPYGRQELLPRWRLDVAVLAPADAKQRVLEDYVDYLRANIGLTFNYLVSRGHRNEFGFATNGSVGRGDPAPFFHVLSRSR